MRRRHRVIDQPIQDLATHQVSYVTVSVLAEYLHVERDTIVKMIRLQSLFAIKVGREWRIPTESARKAFPAGAWRSRILTRGRHKAPRIVGDPRAHPSSSVCLAVAAEWLGVNWQTLR